MKEVGTVMTWIVAAMPFPLIMWNQWQGRIMVLLVVLVVLVTMMMMVV